MAPNWQVTTLSLLAAAAVLSSDNATPLAMVLRQLGWRIYDGCTMKGKKAVELRNGCKHTVLRSSCASSFTLGSQTVN